MTYVRTGTRHMEGKWAHEEEVSLNSEPLPRLKNKFR
jgi:hypothetical protein